MSRHKLAGFLTASGVEAQLLEFEGSVHSVAEAAETAGVRHDELIKSVVVMAKGSPAVCIIPGDRRLDMKKARALLDVSGNALAIAKPEEVLQSIGFPVGGVPPVFDNPSGIPVFIDPAVLEKPVVLGGGGDPSCLLKIAPAEIVRVMGAKTAPLCPD